MWKMNVSVDCTLQMTWDLGKCKMKETTGNRRSKSAFKDTIKNTLGNGGRKREWKREGGRGRERGDSLELI